MRLHVASLPWTETTGDYLSCAYTQKVVKFCQMMDSLGHEVILYSGEENEAPCSEHHAVVKTKERLFWFGNYDPVAVSTIPGISWQPSDVHWSTMNARIVDLMKGSPPEDIVCVISGWCQQPICAAYPHMNAVEWGIGYSGVVPSCHWCFESSAWMHYTYARQNVVNGRWYDVVIPNSFDPADFRFGRESGDYLLYIGRIVQRKGVEVAAKIADGMGMKLIVAGPGAEMWGPNWVRNAEVHVQGSHLEYHGCADKETRAELMAGAAAVLVPTYYIEPFGGVAVEAMMSGTPVVATPWGAFNETVREGVSGYTFHTLPEGIEAVKKAMELDREEIRRYAERYSIWNVRHEYDDWLRRIDGLWVDGRGVGDWEGKGAA